MCKLNIIKSGWTFFIFFSPALKPAVVHRYVKTELEEHQRNTWATWTPILKGGGGVLWVVVRTSGRPFYFFLGQCMSANKFNYHGSLKCNKHWTPVCICRAEINTVLREERLYRNYVDIHSKLNVIRSTEDSVVICDYIRGQHFPCSLSLSMLMDCLAKMLIPLAPFSYFVTNSKFRYWDFLLWHLMQEKMQNVLCVYLHLCI